MRLIAEPPASRAERGEFISNARACPVCDDAGPHPLVRWTPIADEVEVHCRGCGVFFDASPMEPFESTGIELYDRFLRTIGGPPALAEKFRFGFCEHATRQRLAGKFSWAVPTAAALRLLALLAPIIEFGAGTGYWKHECWRLTGERRWQAFDTCPPDGRTWAEGNDADSIDYELAENKAVNPYHYGHAMWRRPGATMDPVGVGDPSLMRRTRGLGFDTRGLTLFLCWPPMSDMAARALGHFQGRRVVYVGEDGGCTADRMFFRLLDRCWRLVHEEWLPQWSGIHDHMAVYERRRS